MKIKNLFVLILLGFKYILAQTSEVNKYNTFEEFIERNGWRLTKLEYVSKHITGEIELPECVFNNNEIDISKVKFSSLGLKHDEDNFLYYRVKKTNYVIELLPLKRIREKYNFLQKKLH